MNNKSFLLNLTAILSAISIACTALLFRLHMSSINENDSRPNRRELQVDEIKRNLEISALGPIPTEQRSFDNPNYLNQAAAPKETFNGHKHSLNNPNDLKRSATLKEVSNDRTNLRREKPQTSLQKEVSDNHEHDIGCWLTLNILDFGAVGDNQTDNTDAFKSAFQAIDDNAASDSCKNIGRSAEPAGGEVIVPKGQVFKTAPFNLTSNSILTVEGTIFGLPNQTAFPAIRAPPSYGRCADMRGLYRRHPLVFAKDKVNVTIRGEGIIDGGGWYWYPFFFNFTAAHNIGRPHLMELNNCTDVEITGVTLKDSAFWTLHPIYCKNVHIHHMKLDAPSCRNYQCANTDGIDIDSSENVLVEYNHINVGDDHVTVLAGKLRNQGDVIRSPPTRNVTVQHNTLGTGMGLAIGSSTAGGVSDVLYYNNTMFAEEKGQYGQGVHIKLRDRFGGYVRNISWIDNVFHSVSQAIRFESGYQGNKAWKHCDENSCPEVRDIVVRNLTVHKGRPGAIQCYDKRPCVNITFENINFHNKEARVGCVNVESGAVIGNDPNELFDLCTNLTHLPEPSTAQAVEI